MMMNDQQIAAAKALKDALTQPAPWSTQTNEFDEFTVVDANGFWVAEVGETPHEAEFIAACPTLVPELIETVIANNDLRALCMKFINDHHISEAACICQNDRVIEHAYAFIEGICEIVGYHKRTDGEV